MSSDGVVSRLEFGWAGRIKQQCLQALEEASRGVVPIRHTAIITAKLLRCHATLYITFSTTEDYM